VRAAHYVHLYAPGGVRIRLILTNTHGTILRDARILHLHFIIHKQYWPNFVQYNEHVQPQYLQDRKFFELRGRLFSRIPVLFVLFRCGKIRLHCLFFHPRQPVFGNGKHRKNHVRRIRCDENGRDNEACTSHVCPVFVDFALLRICAVSRDHLGAALIFMDELPQHIYDEHLRILCNYALFVSSSLCIFSVFREKPFRGTSVRVRERGSLGVERADCVVLVERVHACDERVFQKRGIFEGRSTRDSQ
jgi:hypothetical protein